MNVLITGGSSGIGAEAATALKNAGFTVYAAARRTDRMRPLAAAGAKVIALDVTDDASISAALSEIIGVEGPNQQECDLASATLG